MFLPRNVCVCTFHKKTFGEIRDTCINSPDVNFFHISDYKDIALQSIRLNCTLLIVDYAFLSKATVHKSFATGIPKIMLARTVTPKVLELFAREKFKDYILYHDLKNLSLKIDGLYQQLAYDLSNRKEGVLGKNTLVLESVISGLFNHLQRYFIIIIDQNYIITYCGGEEFSRRGLSAKEYLGKPISTVLAPYGGEATDLFLNAYRKAFEGTTQSLEWNTPAFSFHVKIIPVVSNDSVPQSLLVFAEDRTEIRKQEAQVIKAQSAFQQSLERITDGFVSLDNNLHYTYVNNKAGEILKMDTGEMIGKFIWDVFPDAVGSSFYYKFLESIQSGQSFYSEESYDKNDNWYGVHVYPSEDGCSIYFTNITQQIKRHNEIEEHSRFKDQLLQALPDVLYIFNISENTTEYVSESIKSALGYSKEDILIMGSNVMELLMHPDDRKSYLHQTLPLFSKADDSEVILTEYRMRDIRGNWQWFSSKESVYSRRQDGSPETIFGVATLITETRRKNILVSGENRILKMISQNHTLEVILNEVALTYDRSADSGVCSILLVDEEGKMLITIAAPGLPALFNQQVKNFPIGPKAGSCGTAVYRRENVIVQSIKNDPLWEDYRDIALEFGLKACWSVPVFNNEGFAIGSFAVYYHEEKTPQESELQLIERSADLVKVVLELFNKSKQLHESQSRFRSTFEHITDGFIQLDKNWNYTFVNQKAGMMIGKDPDSLIGKNILEVFPEDKKLEVYKAYHRAMETQEYLHFVDYYPPLNKWFENHVYPSSRGITNYFRDITDRINEQHELQQAHARLELAEEQAGLGSWEVYVSQNPVKRFWSKQMFRHFGFEPANNPPPFEEYLKRVHPDDQVAIRKAFNMMLEGNEPKTRIYRTNPALLPLKYFFASWKLVKDSQENAIKFRGTLLDITERIQKEDELKSSEARYRSLIENASDGIVIFNPDLTYHHSNQMAVDLIGYSLEELKFMRITDVVVLGPDDPPLKITEIDTGERFIQERKLRRKNGTFLIAEISGTRLADGNYMTIIRDITRRKEQEAQIEALQTGLVNLINNVDGIVWEADAQTFQFTFVSKQCEKLLGYPSEDWTTKENFWVQHIHPEDRSWAVNFCLTQTQALSDHVFEYRMIAADGSVKWLRDIVTVTLEKGMPVKLSGIMVDITEKKLVEMNLIKSKDQFQKLVENISGVYWVNNLTVGKTVYISPSYETIWKRSVENVYANPSDFLAAVHPEDVPKVKAAYDELINNGSSGLTYRIFSGTHELRWIKASTRVIPDHNGELFEYGYAEDITEIILAQEERTMMSLRNQQIISSMIDGFILADHLGKIIEVNPAYCRLSGYQQEELIGMNIHEIETALSDKEIENRISEMLAQKALRFETKHLKKDRSLIDLEVSISIMSMNSKPLVAAFVKDITDRKLNETQIRNSNQKLHQLTMHLQHIREAERASLARELHDELGQQLTALKMDLAWIRSRVKGDQKIESKFIDTIKLTDEAVSTIRRINSELRPSLLDELGLVAALEHLVNEFGKRSNVKCKFTSKLQGVNINKEVSIGIFRIVQESLTNAYRHSGASYIQVELDAVKRGLRLVIIDNGKGFTEEEKNKSNRFGLIGMQERAATIKSDLLIQSTPGTGTTISLIVPEISADM
jgi:PAS domain S-box-containing protein